MSKNYLIFLSAVTILFNCCKSRKENNDLSDVSKMEKISIKQRDTVTVKNTEHHPDSIIPKSKSQTVPAAGYLKNEEAISRNPPYLQADLKQHLDWLKTKWQHVPNPITASYQGNDFGDYHHIIFKNKKGETYDFGQAANQYGKYQLHDLSGQYKDNPLYLGRTFRVYWEWKLSNFLCCEGDYDKARAYLPAITKLELIK